MNRLILVLLLAFPVSGFALSATTVEDAPACITKEWLSDMVQFVLSKDYQSAKAYIEQRKCLLLKGGLKVTVTQSPGFSGNRSGFVFQGVKFWTTREGLTNYRAGQ